MSAREHLPNRRRATAFGFELAGVEYRAQVSCFADGRPGEVFLDGPKIGSSAQIAAQDAAIAASLALQFGCPADVLRHALHIAGPIGKALDMLGGSDGR